MNKKLFIVTSFLVSSLLGLLLMLIHWGNRSIELRQALFLDQVNVEVEEVISTVEGEYYCFDLKTEMALPKLDSFYLINPPGVESSEHSRLQLEYVTSEGEKKQFEKMPIMGPGHMQVYLRFEFDNIPEFKDDSSLTNFEKWVRDSYAQYLYTEDGIRLVDTARLDTLLANSVTKFYPEAEIRYSLSLVNDDKELYVSKANESGGLVRSDIQSVLFSNEENIPNVLLTLEVTNMKDMLSDQAWNIYLSASLLAIVSFLILFFLIRMYLQQKNLLQVQKDFVHGMTHEFNTPLSNIKLVAQSLSKNGDAKILKSASILEEEAGKLQVGMNLILTTALIEKNELALDKEKIDVSVLLSKTIEKNKVFLNEAGIDISLKINGEDFLTTGDVFHLENVFQNMINNVRKHSQANFLEVETVRQNGHVIVNFSDNGRGVQEEDRERIFEKFESRHPNGAKNGYGLGLYYSRMILEMQGGAIRLLGNAGKGSVFSIELPA